MSRKIVLVIILCLSMLNIFSQTVTDIDGNIYNTVIIGNQVWMASNLKTTKYRNGVTIPGSLNNSLWQNNTTGARAYYNNDSVSNAPDYGTIYNWYAVNNSNNLCPSGWRVPTDIDWMELINFVGGLNVAGGILKEKGTMHWIVPNTDATNDYGYTALPAGLRHVTGPYQYKTNNGWWWSSTSQNATYAWNIKMFYDNGSVAHYTSEKKTGFSVRCLKDTVINGSFELENFIDIKIYPNPTSDIIMIETELEAEINIINSIGKKMLNLKSIKPATTIDLSIMPAGVYSMVIRTKNGVFNKMIIKLN